MPDQSCQISTCDCADAGLSAELADCAGPTGPQGQQGVAGANGVQTYLGADFDPNGIQSGSRGDLYKSDPVLGGDGTLWVNSNGAITGWV